MTPDDDDEGVTLTDPLPTGWDTWRVDLRNMRNMQGLTQWDLADRLQVDNACISRWETGERTPSVANLYRWARALGADMEVKFHLKPR